MTGGGDSLTTGPRRRAVLGSLGSALAVAVAGCAGGDDSNPAGSVGDSANGDAGAVFDQIRFAGPNLVVELASDHAVEQLNLIDPDGQAFAQARVAEGATQVELQILSKVGESYTAGGHELVAVTEEREISRELSLRPEVRIVDITPELDEQRHTTGRLLVTVRNVGTAPTWIYNIGFRNAPFPNAPDVLESPVGTTFERPDDPSLEFITPETERTLLKKRGVLLFEEDGAACVDGTITVTVVVQTPHGDVEQPVQADLSGGFNIRDQLAARHPCKDVELSLVSGGEGSA